MAYKECKNVSNPFFSKVKEKWIELSDFEGYSPVEIIVKSVSEIIVLIFLIALIPIGAIISIYNTFYNLQKKAYDELMCDNDSTSSQFALSVEFGIYVLLSLPFLLILIPYWIIATVVTWFAKHKILAIILIVIVVAVLIFKDQLMAFFREII